VFRPALEINVYFVQKYWVIILKVKAAGI